MVKFLGLKGAATRWAAADADAVDAVPAMGSGRAGEYEVVMGCRAGGPSASLDQQRSFWEELLASSELTYSHT